MGSPQKVADHMKGNNDGLLGFGTVVKDQGMEGPLASCSDPIQAMLVRMDSRFDAMDLRLDGMDLRLDKMDIRMDQIQSSLDVLIWTQRNVPIRRYNSAKVGGFHPLHKERAGGEHKIGSLPPEGVFPLTEMELYLLSNTQLMELEEFYCENFGEGSVKTRQSSFRRFITDVQL